MFYDLNIPYAPGDPDLPRTISFLAELGYTTLVLSHNLNGKVPSVLPPPPPVPPSFPVPSGVKLLTRCTFTLSDPSQNHRLSTLQSHYSLLALRPTTEKALQQACSTLECDIISLDLSQRLGYHFKHKMLASAIQRGVRFEICYSCGLQGGDVQNARRHLITNATALIRTTRGRGIVISSEARKALGCRGPWDVVNLAAVWGLGQERGKEAVCEEARKVVVRARMMRESWRGVVDVKFGGDVAQAKTEGHLGWMQERNGVMSGTKRKADVIPDEAEKVEPPVSKREMKRRAKKARLEVALERTGTDTADKVKTGTSTPASDEQSKPNALAEATNNGG